MSDPDLPCLCLNPGPCEVRLGKLRKSWPLSRSKRGKPVTRTDESRVKGYSLRMWGDSVGQADILKINLSIRTVARDHQPQARALQEYISPRRMHRSCSFEISLLNLVFSILLAKLSNASSASGTVSEGTEQIWFDNLGNVSLRIVFTSLCFHAPTAQ